MGERMSLNLFEKVLFCAKNFYKMWKKMSLMAKKGPFWGPFLTFYLAPLI